MVKQQLDNNLTPTPDRPPAPCGSRPDQYRALPEEPPPRRPFTVGKSRPPARPPPTLAGEITTKWGCAQRPMMLTHPGTPHGETCGKASDA